MERLKVISRVVGGDDKSAEEELQKKRTRAERQEESKFVKSNSSTKMTAGDVGARSYDHLPICVHGKVKATISSLTLTSDI